jgi:hypothetical protein
MMALRRPLARFPEALEVCRSLGQASPRQARQEGNREKSSSNVHRIV